MWNQALFRLQWCSKISYLFPRNGCLWRELSATSTERPSRPTWTASSCSYLHDHLTVKSSWKSTKHHCSPIQICSVWRDFGEFTLWLSTVRDTGWKRPNIVMFWRPYPPFHLAASSLTISVIYILLRHVQRHLLVRIEKRIFPLEYYPHSYS